MSKKKIKDQAESFRINLIDGLGLHVTKDGVLWFGKEVYRGEGGSMYETLTDAQAYDKLAQHMGETINPTIGAVPPTDSPMFDAAFGHRNKSRK